MVKAMDQRAFEKLVKSYGCYISDSKNHQIVKTKDGDVTVAYVSMRHPEKIYLSWAVREFLEGAKKINLTPK
ncbi:MAG: hypothetical protein P4L53_20790 [Candidatus Obscuribacterales bacterium]|nr:hypothetical protein [Candidatus Obscuribacterales bacterium]